MNIVNSPKDLLKFLAPILKDDALASFLRDGEYDAAYEMLSRDDALLAGFFIKFMSEAALDPGRAQLLKATTRSDLAKCFGPDENGTFKLAFFKVAPPFPATLTLDPDSVESAQLYDAIQSNIESVMYKAAVEWSKVNRETAGAPSRKLDALMDQALPGAEGSSTGFAYTVRTARDFYNEVTQAEAAAPVARDR